LGPRALGNRSIIADPRNPQMQRLINSKIKSREIFRPFAPSILAEDISVYFDSNSQSPYMLFVKSIRTELRRQEPDNYAQLGLLDRLYHIRSDIPAVTHVDYSARVQSVDKGRNPKFWQLINNFKQISGCSALINTSFNVRDEPIVCSPEDAYLDFIRTELDYLVIGDYLFDKKKQKQFSVETFGKNNFI
jgi:carbamoyltransferase